MPSSETTLYSAFTYTFMHEKSADGLPKIHHTRVWDEYKQWGQAWVSGQNFYATLWRLEEAGVLNLSAPHGDSTNFNAKLGNDITEYSGYKYQKGNKIFALQDNIGIFLTPITVSTVNQLYTALLTDVLNDMKTICVQN